MGLLVQPVIIQVSLTRYYYREGTLPFCSVQESDREENPDDEGKNLN